MRPPVVLTGLAVLTAAVLLVLPVPEGANPTMMRSAALVFVALTLWATGALPEYITSITFLLFGMLLAVAPPQVVFAGFHSTAVWLVFGGLILGVAIRATGLGERLARMLIGIFGLAYTRLIGGLMFTSVLFSFVMPSSLGRVLILIPIVNALADRLGFPAGSKGRTGVIMAAGLGTLIPAFTILPSNVPNMVLAGATETLYGIQLTYGSYAALQAPIGGLLKSFLIFGLILWLFPHRSTEAATENDDAPSKPLSPGERKLAWILAAALAFWVTDFWHGISPAWVAMAAGLLCLLPGVGMLPASAFNEKVQFGGMFYIAGILGLGAVVAESGLGSTLGRALLEVLDLQPGDTARNFAALTGVFTLTGMLTTMPALPAVLSPLAGEIAQATGLPLITVLMIEVLAFSTIILPYQMPPVVIMVQLGRVPYGHAVRMTVALAIATIILVTPLSYWWWQLLGYLP